VFGLMIAAQIMVILDVSVVNVALPSISRGLHLSAADYQWTVSAYVLLSGGLLLLGGRIADLINRRSAFLTGVGLFTAASLASGLAQAPWTLIASRAAQGASTAAVVRVHPPRPEERPALLGQPGIPGIVGPHRSGDFFTREAAGRRRAARRR